MIQKASDYSPSGDNTLFYRAAIQEPSPAWFEAFTDSYIDDGYGEPFGVTMGKFVAAGNITLFAPSYLSKGGNLLSHHEVATKRLVEGDPSSLETRIPEALAKAAAQGVTLLGPIGRGIMTDGGFFSIGTDHIQIFSHSGTYGSGDRDARVQTVQAVQAALPDIEVVVEQ